MGSVDLLDELRAALDGLEPLLVGRVVDIEMARLRVLADRTLFQRGFNELVGYLAAHSEPATSITVRVARSGKVARIEVFGEGGHVYGEDWPDLGPAAAALQAMGGDIGTTGTLGWITLPLAPGTANADS